MSSGEDIFKAGPDISNVIGVHLGVKLMVMSLCTISGSERFPVLHFELEYRIRFSGMGMDMLFLSTA